MKRWLWALALAAMAVAAPRLADATTCTIPYTFFPNTLADATQVNADFSAVATCASTIDNTNIGPAGIFASQIIPLTVGEATFGGSQPYTFPSDIAAAGTIAAGPLTLGPTFVTGGSLVSTTTASSGQLVLGGSTSYGKIDYGQSNANLFTTSVGLVVNGPITATNISGVLYDTAGNSHAGHVVFVSANMTVNNGAYGGSVAISLTGAAQFTSNTSYGVSCNAANAVSGFSGNVGVPTVAISGGTGFTAQLTSAGTPATGTQSIPIVCVAAGY